MTNRYFVRLSYLGTDYSGWQIQPNAITVQQILQSNLTKLNKNEPVKIMGCGRTDAGVHAKNFYMHMDFPKIEDIEHFIYKLNHMLPHSIAVHAVAEMKATAHARFSAIERTYQYFFHTKKDPFYEDRSLLISASVNTEKMKAGAAVLLNHSNFEAFSRVRTEVSNFICHLTEASFHWQNDQLIFTISANRFLRNMVRAIVGTLLELGEGKISLQEFENIIISRDRNKAGKSAPAKALFLNSIKYPFAVS